MSWDTQAGVRDFSLQFVREEDGAGRHPPLPPQMRLAKRILEKTESDNALLRILVEEMTVTIVPVRIVETIFR